MGKFNFNGPSYESQSLSADAQKTVNWYPEQIESGDGNTQLALYPSPGTKTFVELIPPAPPGGQAGLQNVRVQLSAAQLNSARNTSIPIPLIPAQGPDLAIITLSMVLQYQFVSIPYSIGAGTRLLPNLMYGANPTDADLTTAETLFVSIAELAQTFDTIQMWVSTSANENLIPAKWVNQPLVWWDDTEGGVFPDGDGIITLNIQFYVLNVVTGQIVNGQPKRVSAAITQISTAQYKNAHSAPIQLVPAPGGANQVTVPLTNLLWTHFNTLASNTAVGLSGDYGIPPNDTIPHTGSLDLLSVDPAGFTKSHDTIQQVSFNRLDGGVSPVPTAKYLNQPLSLLGSGDAPGATGDPTATAYTIYLTVDLATGELLEGTGDYFNAITQLSAAQMKSAFTATNPVGPAPGANKINIPLYSTCQSHFNGTPYTLPLNTLPDPRVTPGPVAPVFTEDLITYNIIDGGTTVPLWASSVDFMSLARAIFYDSNVLPVNVINQPISWKDETDLSGSPANTTATVNMGYVVIDSLTGALNVA